MYPAAAEYDPTSSLTMNHVILCHILPLAASDASVRRQLRKSFILLRINMAVHSHKPTLSAEIWLLVMNLLEPGDLITFLHTFPHFTDLLSKQSIFSGDWD